MLVVTMDDQPNSTPSPTNEVSAYIKTIHIPFFDLICLEDFIVNICRLILFFLVFILRKLK